MKKKKNEGETGFHSRDKNEKKDFSFSIRFPFCNDLADWLWSQGHMIEASGGPVDDRMTEYES